MKFSVSLNMERFSPSDSMTATMENTLELARMADQGGFEEIWTPEHHTIECTIAPNPFTLLTWYGQHTEQVRLGTATVVAPYWNPIRLAGEAALCDHLTGGRLDFGIARGAYQYEIDRMAGPISPAQGVAYMKELVPAVRALWSGDYAHEGEFWRFPLSTSVPKPLQKPHPPLWVAARDPSSFDWAVANGANIMSTPLSAPMSEVGILGEKYRKAVSDHPVMRRPKFLMLRRACVYEKAANWELPVKCSIDYGRTFENLFQNIGTVTSGFPEAVSYDAVKGRDNYSPDNIRRNMLFGTPDEVIEKLLVYEAEGVDQMCLGICFGTPFESQRKTLELFTKEIIPVFAARERDRARIRETA